MASRIPCPECDKTFRKDSGLAWHLERTHGQAQQSAVFHQPSEQQMSERQPVSLLEGRLQKLERVTGLRESDFIEGLTDGVPLTEQLSRQAEQVTKLSDTVSKLSEPVELAQAGKLAEQDTALRELTEKFELELNSLAAVVNKYRDAFNYELTHMESRIGKVQRMVSKLHVCPDCGASLHLHRLEKDSWHLECLLCGYYSVNYKYPKWKEQSGKHPIPVKQ